MEYFGDLVSKFEMDQLSNLDDTTGVYEEEYPTVAVVV